MTNILLGIALLGLLAVAFGAASSRALRRAARIVSVLGTLLFGLLTLACLYAAIRFDNQGGGVFLLLALPGAGFTALFAYALFGGGSEGAPPAPPRPDGASTAHDDIDAQIARLRADLLATQARLERGWLGARRRERLRERIASNRERLAWLQQMQAAATTRGDARDTSPR